MLEMFTAVTVQLQNAWFRLQDEESGQGLVEYALIIVVVSLGSLVALKFLRNSISDLFNKAGSSIVTGAN